MRIYDGEAFLKLPQGTVYAKGLPWAFGELSVKGERAGGLGYWSRNLVDIQSNDSGDMCERLDRMRAEGTSEPINDAVSRSVVDPRIVYLVFEREDLLELASAAINAACVTPT